MNVQCHVIIPSNVRSHAIIFSPTSSSSVPRHHLQSHLIIIPYSMYDIIPNAMFDATHYHPLLNVRCHGITVPYPMYDATSSSAQ